jgi:hypothetical protein
VPIYLLLIIALSGLRRASAKGLNPAPPPNLSSRVGALGLRKFCGKSIDAYPSPSPLSRLERRALASYTLEIALAAAGAAAMTRSVHTATLVVLLCLPVLALSDLTAWAKHHRMGPYFSQPCPDRCNSTRKYLLGLHGRDKDLRSAARLQQQSERCLR